MTYSWFRTTFCSVPLGSSLGPIENASRAASTEAIMKLLNGAAFNVPSSFSVDTNAIGRGIIEEVNSR